VGRRIEVLSRAVEGLGIWDLGFWNGDSWDLAAIITGLLRGLDGIISSCAGLEVKVALSWKCARLEVGLNAKSYLVYANICKYVPYRFIYLL